MSQSKADLIQRNRVLYEGDCRDCGEHHLVHFPHTDEFRNDPDPKHIRCPGCRTINYWPKVVDIEP